MIRELTIRNLALIEHLSLKFDSGFSVFTGETGAGKSILIGAIGLLLGERASSESIRSETEEAEINGVFELTDLKSALKILLEELTIPIEEDVLIIRRIISRGGRNRIFINQVPLPLSSLKKVGDLLIDLHGQHDHQFLLNPDSPTQLMDSLESVLPSRKSYTRAYNNYNESKTKLNEHMKNAALLDERREMMEFQLKELAQLRLHSGEENELEQELSLLSSSTDRVRIVSEIGNLLAGDRSGPSDILGKVLKSLRSLARYDDQAENWISDIENVVAVTGELEGFCSSYLQQSEAEADPNRLEKINGRLAKIQRLKKKHRCSFEDLISKQQQLQGNLEALENSFADADFLEKECSRKKGICLEEGGKLTEARKCAASSFDSQISDLMQNLGFNKGGWKTEFKSLGAPSATGLEDISFMVRTNPGEPFLPLIRIASGGEISRLMLAIKSIFAENDAVPILIFDEIDTGIGGILAKEVANALYRLCSSHQVICISHLHQIASVADHHYVVFKEERNGRTGTHARRLSYNDKVDEIARMFGDTSDASKKHARELLKNRIQS